MKKSLSGEQHITTIHKTMIHYTLQPWKITTAEYIVWTVIGWSVYQRHFNWLALVWRTYEVAENEVEKWLQSMVLLKKIWI